MDIINRQQLKAKLDASDDFVLIDVVEAEAFEEFHLPKARSVPLGDDFVQRMRLAFPRQDLEVVVHCRDGNCPKAHQAAEALLAAGYRKVSAYEAGRQDWRQAGLPVVF